MYSNKKNVKRIANNSSLKYMNYKSFIMEKNVRKNVIVIECTLYIQNYNNTLRIKNVVYFFPTDAVN